MLLSIALLLSLLPAQSAPQAFAGLSLRDNPEGCVVSRVWPGPFGGDGLRSASLWRGDLLVSANGQKVDSKAFTELLGRLAPGAELTLVYRRRTDAEAHLGDAVPSGDPRGEERTITVALDARSDWQGTIGMPLRAGARMGDAPEGEFEKRILAEAAKQGLRAAPDGLDALLKHLGATQDHVLDANSSPLVVQALRRPLALDRIEAGLAGEVRRFLAVCSEPTALGPALHRLVRSTIDGQPAALPEHSAIEPFLQQCAAERTAWRARAQELVAWHRDSVSIDPAHARESLALLRASPELATHALQLATLRLERLAADETGLARATNDVPQALRERVAEAVQGAVLAAFELDGGLCVVGGPGANVYEMSKLAGVHDRGGNDRYVWSAPFEGTRQLVVDLAGDDAYESQVDFAGPGVAVFGVSVVDDLAGDDTYTSTRRFSQACGLFGIGILLDRKGDDRYTNTSGDAGFAQGVGYWGAGLLVDLAGDDVYVAEKLAQGVGGPRGFGALVDVAGKDSYRANGPAFASVYGTAGAFVGMSQGMGYGIRADAAGGVGALFDLAGDDRYDVGEFGQGCGYFFALGVLHDLAGDDVYASQRYGQGTGAHQAAGILVDDAGDDRYSCKQVAFQGGAWDETVAWLIDRKGDDVYAGFGLGQGAAAQQALGVLVDCAGKDVYDSPQAQGESGGNEYHFGECGIFSFSLLLDLGGGKDAYSTGRANDATTRTGARNESNPALSNLHGLCVDG